MTAEGQERGEAMDAEQSPEKRRPLARSGRRPAAQVRGVLAERVVVSTALDPFLSLRSLAGYSSVSVRKLHDYLADPAHPLPHYRVGGKIVVRRSEFDAWMAAYRRIGRADVAAIVDEVMRSLRPIDRT
jgi:Helix-turn-helix domain